MTEARPGKPAKFGAHQARLITGLVLAGLVLALVLAGPFWSVALLFSLAAAIAMAEFSGLALSGKASLLKKTVGILAAFLGPLLALMGPGAVAAGLGLGLLACAAGAISGHAEPEARVRELLARGFGVLYCGGLFACLVLCARRPSGGLALIFLIVCVVAADAGAYYAGHMWGKRKLAPSISPGKSVEGMLGGLILAACLGGLYARITPLEMSWYHGAALGAILALVSVAGDLTESILKRAAGAKDSGKILPGHGGVLDRVDGLLFAAPVLLLYLEWTIP